MLRERKEKAPFKGCVEEGEACEEAREEFLGKQKESSLSVKFQKSLSESRKRE